MAAWHPPVIAMLRGTGHALGTARASDGMPFQLHRHRVGFSFVAPTSSAHLALLPSSPAHPPCTGAQLGGRDHVLRGAQPRCGDAQRWACGGAMRLQGRAHPGGGQRQGRRMLVQLLLSAGDLVRGPRSLLSSPASPVVSCAASSAATCAASPLPPPQGQGEIRAGGVRGRAAPCRREATERAHRVPGDAGAVGVAGSP